MILYRLILCLIAPVLLGVFLVRVLFGRERWRDLGERLGNAPAIGRHIWIHGASNGELTSARPLIDALRARAPDLPLRVTANSVTGRDMVRGWALPDVHASLAPIDLRPVLARRLGQGRPALLISLENEVWPNRIAVLAQRGIPVAMVGARLSARSARRWAQLPGLAATVFGGAALVSAQYQASADRLRDLGVPADRMLPVLNLKAATAPATLPQAVPDFPRADTILAAATHDGEEHLVLAAYQSARAARPDLRLILAPRHPRRGDAVAALIAERGLGFARRTDGAEPGRNRPVYLADTLGEMSAWYRAASVTFVGGSLVAKGGHTPFEPAQWQSAIVHGPHVTNFEDAYAALAAADAARQVADADALAEIMATWTGTPKAAATAERATAALRPLAGDAGALADRLLALIAP